MGCVEEWVAIFQFPDLLLFGGVSAWLSADVPLLQIWWFGVKLQVRRGAVRRGVVVSLLGVEFCAASVSLSGQVGSGLSPERVRGGSLLLCGS